jgi:hypothetical protein
MRLSLSISAALLAFAGFVQASNVVDLTPESFDEVRSVSFGGEVRGLRLLIGCSLLVRASLPWSNCESLGTACERADGFLAMHREFGSS